MYKGSEMRLLILQRQQKIKSIHCSCREPQLDSQAPTWLFTVALLSEDLVPSSSVVCECQIYTWYTYKHADKTLINKYNYKKRNGTTSEL